MSKKDKNNMSEEDINIIKQKNKENIKKNVEKK